MTKPVVERPSSLPPTMAFDTSLHRSAGSLAQLVRTHGITGLVYDLDGTLVQSSPVHRELLFTALNGSVDRPRFEACYDKLRGQSYTTILAEVHKLGGADAGPLDRFVSSVYELAGQVARGERRLAIEPQMIPDSDRLVLEGRALGLTDRVCTGSPRAIAEMLIARTPLASHLPPDRLVCCGDSPFNKHDAAYWDRFFPDVDRSKFMAFDDHPHSAEWLLEVGRVGLLLLRPTVPLERCRDLLDKYAPRVLLVNEWSDLLP